MGTVGLTTTALATMPWWALERPLGYRGRWAFPAPRLRTGRLHHGTWPVRLLLPRLSSLLKEVEPMTCGCDWSLGDCCEKCTTNPDNPNGIYTSPEEHERWQGLFSEWALAEA